MEYEEYYDDFYDDGEYVSLELGCFPLLLAVIGVTLFLAFSLSRVELSIPMSTEASVKLSGSTTRERHIAPLFTPEIQFWADNIAIWSQQTGIDPNLIATVMQIESCGDPGAVSSAGALGLFQVMPYHFEDGEDPFKPVINALRGLDYLRRALEERDGVVRFGLAGYNGGITGAKRPESAWPNETRRYVYWGTGIYEDAIRDKANSDRLNEWLGSGGASLCDQAAQRLGIDR